MSSIRLEKKIIIYILLLIPFFELQTFELMEKSTILPALWGLIESLLSVMRLAITLICFGIYVFKKNVMMTITLACTTIFVVLENLVSLINGSLYINYTIGSLSIIGFVLLCQLLITDSEDCFVRAGLIFFGVLSVIGSITIFIKPYGLYNATTLKAFGVYFLGAKNTSVFFYLAFLFFYAYYQYKRNSFDISIFVFGIMFLAAAVVCDSMNSFLTLGLVLGLLFLMYFKYKLRQLVSPLRLIAVSVFIAGIILIPTFRMLLVPILEMVGRDTTFTGRDVLWQQAIDIFMNHPFVGAGIRTGFVLATGVIQDNAHSNYLDILAKYGIGVFLSHVSNIVLVIVRACQSKSRSGVYLKAAFVFAIVIHSITDNMNTYFFLMFMMVTELFDFDVKHMSDK